MFIKIYSSALFRDFTKILEELVGQDYWRHQKSFSGGVQEYIEAATLFHYLESKELLSLEQASIEMLQLSEDDLALDEPPRFPLSIEDYFSGIADLTGELMRQCVSRAGENNFLVALFLLILIME